MLETSYDIDTVVSHVRGHNDERSSRALIGTTTAGKRFFPGFADARYVDFDPTVHEDGRAEEAWLAKGTVFIGCRGGHV